jgi:SagB-type dehydrogenase family enzyme
LPAARTSLRFRRARHLVLYWREDRLVAHNYATGRRAVASSDICRLLDCCPEWRRRDEIADALGLPPAPLQRLLLRLVTRGLLERSDRREDSRVRAMRALDSWNPAAGFFHTATKDVRFWPAREATRQARLQAARVPMPAPIKRYRGAVADALPKPARGEFADVLLARRTWRRFSRSREVTLAELATLLSLSLGVQQWVDARPHRLPLKTSPSGGARHPIEGYVVLRKTIPGLAAGIYHYDAGRHRLERLRGRVSQSRIAGYYPASGHFAAANVHIFLTAVLSRQVWRYPYARAYRAALAEAGHVCQTFCLTATWLGLAPFCLMGLADSLLEKDLGLNGIAESVVYAAGVGHRPKGSSWAPRVRGRLMARKNLALG